MFTYTAGFLAKCFAPFVYMYMYINTPHIYTYASVYMHMYVQTPHMFTYTSGLLAKCLAPFVYIHLIYMHVPQASSPSASHPSSASRYISRPHRDLAKLNNA